MINSSNIIFTCINSSKKGFILGGAKGFICVFEIGNFHKFPLKWMIKKWKIDKNLNVTNTTNVQAPNSEESTVINTTINNNDSFGTVVTSTNKDCK